MFFVLFILLMYNSGSQLCEINNDENLEEICEFEHLIKGPTIQISEVDLEEYFKFTDQIKWSKSDEFVPAEIFDEYVEELCVNIINYIDKSLYNVQRKKYIKKMNCIKKSLGMISEDLKKEEEVFTPEINNDLMNILNFLNSKYSNRLKLDDKTYSNFIGDLDIKINEMKNLNRGKYRSLKTNVDRRANILLKEFLEIYKYIKTVPELLTFGFVLEHNFLNKVLLYFHLITLFLSSQNEGMTIENKIFFIFLLKKTFSYTPRHHLDLIKSKQIQLSSLVDISGLHFFTWELNYKQRRRIMNYLNSYDKDEFYSGGEDKIHLNIILRLYLFQHLTYLKYKNVQNKEFEEFKILVNKIFSEIDDFKTNFYEFINHI